MEDQMETSCFSCFCFCSCPGKKHSKLSHSEKRGRKFTQHIITQTLSSSGSSEGFPCNDQSLPSNDMGNPNPNYQTSHQNAEDREISNFLVADDKEIIPYTLREHEGNESDISHESSVEIPRSRYSETSNQTIYRECRGEFSSDETPRNRDFEISHQRLSDERPSDTESNTSEHSYRLEIPMGMTGSETHSHKSCRHVITSSRGGSEIGHLSSGDEKQKYREYESNQKTYKVEIPTPIKYSETSSQHNSCRDGISIHTGCDSGHSERSDCDSDSGQSERSSCDNERYSCNYIRKPIPRYEKTYGNRKETGISKIAFADHEEVKQYTMNEQDGEESEIRQHVSRIIKIPRNRDSKTSSETSRQESCRDRILGRRNSEISPNSYRDENPRFRESKNRHKMSKIVVADDKDLKQYTMSEHDGEASEISSHENFSVEHDGEAYEISSHENYSVEQDGEASEISSHENYNVEHDGEASEISSHESYSVEIPRSRDFETRSQNSHTDGIPIRQGSEISQKSSHTDGIPIRQGSEISQKSFRDRIPSSRDSEISHESYSAEKPREGKSKTNHKSPNIETPMPIRHNETNRHNETKGQESSWRKENTICRGSVNRPKSSWRDALSILRFAQFNRRKSRHEIATSTDSKISQRSYRDEKGSEIREKCRDKTPIYIESSGMRDEFENHLEKSIIIRPFGDSEEYAEIIRQLIRQFLAEGGLHAAEILGIADADCIAPLEYQESVHEFAQTHG